MLLGPAPRDAAAAITHHACHVQSDNTMRYDCTVNTSPPTTSYRMGVRPTAGGAWRWFPQTDAAQNNQTLWNFTPGVALDYQVQTNDADTASGSLGTPALPTELASLVLTLDGTVSGTTPVYRTRYVVVDTADCGETTEYVIAVNLFRSVTTGGGLVPYITWYQDVELATGIAGADITGTEVVGEDGRDGVLVIVDKRHLYWWNWAGQEVEHKDYSEGCTDTAGDGADDFGPCPHHAAYQMETGETWVVTAHRATGVVPDGTWAACAAGTEFVNDGLEILSADWSTSTSVTLMGDYGETPYDPAEYEGPNPPASCDSNYYLPDVFDGGGEIDWTHLNAVAPYTAGGQAFALVSLKDFDEIALLSIPALYSGEADWVLNGMDLVDRPHVGGMALGLTIDNGAIAGDPVFSDQHDLRYWNGLLQFLDNNGESTHADYSRVLRVDVHPGSGSAEIVASYVVTDRGGFGQDCPAQGSARVVPGTDGDVLALCQTGRLISELTDPTGAEVPSVMSLTGSCAVGGDPSGWYRAYPLPNLGGQ